MSPNWRKKLLDLFKSNYINFLQGKKLNELAPVPMVSKNEIKATLHHNFSIFFKDLISWTAPASECNHCSRFVKRFCVIMVWRLSAPYVFSVSTVATEASQAAIDHLDGTQNDLQCPHGQQDGEQDHVPHHNVLRRLTFGPQSLVVEIAAVFAAGDHSRSSMCEEGPKEEVGHFHRVECREGNEIDSCFTQSRS